MDNYNSASDKGNEGGDEQESYDGYERFKQPAHLNESYEYMDDYLLSG